ncbi:MAG: hypothetical protein ACTJG9_00940 [Alcaligenes aquatilis]
MDEEWFLLLDKALPILTFIMGLVGSWVTDFLRDNRNYKISRKRESTDFQTKNYLALQIALQDMGRAAAMVLQYEKSLVQDDRPIHTGANEELRASVAKVQVLEERVDSSKVRTAIRSARACSASFGLPGGYSSQTETDFQKAVEELGEAQTILGKSLRKLLIP